MDMKRYKYCRDKKLVNLLSAGGKDQFLFTKRSFKVEDGELIEGDPDIERITRQAIEQLRVDFECAIDGCEALLADMDALAKKE